MRTTDQPDAGAHTVSSTKSAASMISRREAIQRAALLAGVALSPELFTFVGRAQTAAAKTYLSAAQGAIARAAVDRILPRTDTPGAVDVGVPAFIDLFYGEFMSPAEQNRRDSGNDHFRSALGTRPRRAFFGCHFLASHVISSHPTLLEARSTDKRSPVRRGLRPE